MADDASAGLAGGVSGAPGASSPAGGGASTPGGGTGARPDTPRSDQQTSLLQHDLHALHATLCAEEDDLSDLEVT